MLLSSPLTPAVRAAHRTAALQAALPRLLEPTIRLVVLTSAGYVPVWRAELLRANVAPRRGLVVNPGSCPALGADDVLIVDAAELHGPQTTPAQVRAFAFAAGSVVLVADPRTGPAARVDHCAAPAAVGQASLTVADLLTYQRSALLLSTSA